MVTPDGKAMDEAMSNQGKSKPHRVQFTLLSWFVIVLPLLGLFAAFWQFTDGRYASAAAYDAHILVGVEKDKAQVKTESALTKAIADLATAVGGLKKAQEKQNEALQALYTDQEIVLYELDITNRRPKKRGRFPAGLVKH